MFDTRIQKQLFYGELSQGRQQIGRPKKSLQILSQILPQTLLHQHRVVLDVSCRPPILAHNHIHAGSSEDSRGKIRTESAEQKRQTRTVGAIIMQQQHIQPLPTSAPPEGEAFSPGLASPCSHLRIDSPQQSDKQLILMTMIVFDSKDHYEASTKSYTHFAKWVRVYVCWEMGGENWADLDGVGVCTIASSSSHHRVIVPSIQITLMLR